MSSISFPSQPAGDGQYYSPAFDTSASFQMNPLSSHPPRTPRPSTVNTSTSNVYGTTIYESQAGSSGGGPTDAEEHEELDEEDEKAKLATKRVRREEVWRDMVLTSNGRDKAFKLIQYSIRVYLLFHASGGRLLRRSTRPPWEMEFVKRLESTVSAFSVTRKMLLLFNWLEPLTTVMADQTVSFSSKGRTPKTFFQALLQAQPPVLLNLMNAVADDIATLGLVGLFSKRTGDKAGNFANWCWLLCSLVGLVENGVERQMIVNLQRDVESRMYAESMSGATAKSKPTISKIDEKELGRLQKQDYWLQVTRLKLIMDVIFVSYDLFKFKRAEKLVKALTGLTSAILSAAKLYEKHKSSLVKAAKLNIH